MKESFDIVKINETIADVIEDHILVCHLDGQIVYSNKAMESHLGYTGFELKQKNFLDLIVDSHNSKAVSFMKNSSEESSNWQEFLFNGKHDAAILHLKLFQKNNLLYIYGNEKYVEYERLRKKLDNEITNAIKIHKRSLPKGLPKTENISFASLYIPAQELGRGD